MKNRTSFFRRMRYGLETVLAYLVYGFFRLLPLSGASATGGFLLRALGPRMGISRIALKNLDLAFPEKSSAEKQRILVGMWDNLGRVIAEYPHLHRIWPCVELAGREHLEAARDSGRPAIFLAGHLANWEINAIGARQCGLPLHLVYRKPNNSGVDGLLRHARDSGATGHIEKGAAGAREIFSLLRQGQAIGMLVDQKLNEGVAVPFFGHLAMTASAFAQFALKFDCPLYPSRIERLEGCRFRMTVFPALNVTRTGDKEADVQNILVAMNAMLEDWIRARPEQWLWIHKRWPQG